MDFRTALLEPDSFMLAAIEARSLIGVGGLQYSEEGKIATLHTDGVDPNYQNRGIGSALVMARLASIEDDFGCDCVRLLATEFSRGFYGRFGFVMVGVPEFDSSQGFEIVGMEMPFSPDLRARAKRWLSDANVRIEELA